MNMTFEEVKQKLEAQKNISITKIDDIGHGKSIRLSNGSIINCYSTGKVVVQGKNQDVTSQILNNKKFYISL